MTEERELWIFKDGPFYILVPKGLTPDYVRLDPCPKCGQAHYNKISLYLKAKWVGIFTEATGGWLNKLIYGVNSE